MKWALIIYLFTAGPDGGWIKVDKTYYETKQECIEYRDFFNNLPKPGVLMARCDPTDKLNI